MCVRRCCADVEFDESDGAMSSKNNVDSDNEGTSMVDDGDVIDQVYAGVYDEEIANSDNDERMNGVSSFSSTNCVMPVMHEMMRSCRNDDSRLEKQWVHIIDC